MPSPFLRRVPKLTPGGAIATPPLDELGELVDVWNGDCGQGLDLSRRPPHQRPTRPQL